MIVYDRETVLLLLALAFAMVSNAVLVVLIARAANDGRVLSKAAITGVEQNITYSNN